MDEEQRLTAEAAYGQFEEASRRRDKRLRVKLWIRLSSALLWSAFVGAGVLLFVDWRYALLATALWLLTMYARRKLSHSKRRADYKWFERTYTPAERALFKELGEVRAEEARRREEEHEIERSATTIELAEARTSELAVKETAYERIERERTELFASRDVEYGSVVAKGEIVYQGGSFESGYGGPAREGAKGHLYLRSGGFLEIQGKNLKMAFYDLRADLVDVDSANHVGRRLNGKRLAGSAAALYLFGAPALLVAPSLAKKHLTSQLQTSYLLVVVDGDIYGMFNIQDSALGRRVAARPGRSEGRATAGSSPCRTAASRVGGCCHDLVPGRARPSQASGPGPGASAPRRAQQRRW